MKFSELLNPTNLTHKAILTSLNTGLKQIVLLFINFVATPILLAGMGTVVFGAWAMIRQTVGYLAYSDLRPLGTLKMTLAVSQHKNDPQVYRKQIGIALGLWGFTVPIMICVGVVVVFFTPSFIKVQSADIVPTQIAMAIAVLGVILNSGLCLPSNVLYALNLDYKAMGLQATVTFLVGLGSIIAIKMGWGIIGVSAAALIGLIINSGVQFIIAKKVLPWFGFERPSFSEVLRFGKTSFGFFCAIMTTMLIDGGELLIIGVVSSPYSVAIFSTTVFLIRMLRSPLKNLITSAFPGIAGLCGRGEIERVRMIRREAQHLTALVLGAIGTVVLLWNDQFVRLWVGSQFNAGRKVVFFIVLAIFFEIYAMIEEMILDGFLKYRFKTLVNFSLGLLLIAGGALAVKFSGILAFSIVYFLARFSIWFLYFIYVSRLLHSSFLSNLYGLKAVFMLIAALFVFAMAMHWQFLLNWFSLCFASAVSFCAAILIIWFFGLPRVEKNAFMERVKEFLP